MTLTEAMEKAKNGEVISRKYTLFSGAVFTMWGTVKIKKDVGTFLYAGWTSPLKLETLEADNWEVG